MLSLPGRERERVLMKRRWLGFVIAVAVALRLYPWLKPHGLVGVREYDDGVYYGAARMLLHGIWPYRDMTIVHPPGVAVVLAPFAALGEVLGDPAGMALARLALLAVAVTNIVLIYRLAERIEGIGPAGALVAAGIYAISPSTLSAEHTVLLEPIVTLLCLLAARRLQNNTTKSDVAAGAFLGAALCVKLFAAAYVPALLMWLLLRREPRRCRSVLSGFLAVLVVVVSPFLVLAPSAMWRDVVLTQVWRPIAGISDLAARGRDMVGLSSVPKALAAVMLLGLAVAVVRSMRRTGGSMLSAWVALSLLTAAAFLQAATYYPHYGAFLTPAFAVLVGAAVTTAGSRARLSVGQVAAGAIILGLLVGTWSHERDLAPQADVAALRQALSGASCVWYETASSAIATDTLAIPTKQCPAWVDQRGQLYAQIGSKWAHRRGFYFEGFTGNDSWQSAIVDQISHADALLLSHRPQEIREWSETTKAYVTQRFHEDRVQAAGDGRSLYLWRRNATG